MNVLSDLGIPRDVRHISGNGVHTFRFINAAGQSTLLKWYWKPMLGHRALVYDEATKIAGKNNNFQRIDLYNNIAAGIYPEWEFLVQLFPDDGTYMWNGIDLIDPTIVIPFEMNPPMTLGKMTLNKNPTNFFAEPESISFAPSNVVKGISFVPDPLLQWRLMSYDDTANHRHNSPNGYLLPVNKAIVPINNNYRDGYMQPLLFEGASTSSPNDIGGVKGASLNNTTNGTLPYTGNPPEVVDGAIGRYPNLRDSFGQARTFWATLDKYAQQHTVDAYRFELGHVSDTNVQQRYINNILNKVDNCLARRVAIGIGATLPPIGSGPSTTTNTTTKIPSWYPLAPSFEPNKSNAGLVIGILADDAHLSTTDLAAMLPIFSAQKVFYEVISTHIGTLKTGVYANQSFITTSSVFYDAIILGGTTPPTTNNTTTTNTTTTPFEAAQFIQEAYGHGKAIAALGNSVDTLKALGIEIDADMGVYGGAAEAAVMKVLEALMGVVRFPERGGVDDVSICQE
jgi:catalase